MNLGQLVAGYLTAGPHAALPVTGLTADSRQVQPGDLFIALPFLDRPGFQHDGHDFLAAAVAAGAVAVIGSDPARLAAAGVPWLVADSPRWLLPRLAARLLGSPSHQLRLVGVTGTNGKTTTCYLLDAIMAQCGWRTVLAGTVETRLGAERREATTTTPDPVSLQRLWRAAVDRGVAGGCMEASSHALHQARVDHTRFAVAVFTNLTQDHLDYHRTMEEYYLAKARLFAPDDTGHQPRAVVNADDSYGRRLLAGDLREPLAFSLGGEGDVVASEVVFDARGSRYHVVTPAGDWDQQLRIVGPYNVRNALGATAAALALGLPPAAIREALSTATGAPGRLEVVDAGQPFLVLVDYAHTPDALENALAAVRHLTAGRVICVFGCGGDRDRTKRPLMGGLASRLADLAIVTSDNPRTEPAATILDDILAGVDRASGEVLVEVDRRLAIERGLAAAQAGDVVLIAGKGHETYQIVGHEKRHFDDREVAMDWLRHHG